MMDSFAVLSHQVMESKFDSESSWVNVMCRASRFHITVSLKDLRGSCFEMEYSNLVEKFDDMNGGVDEDYEALCSWIVKPCFPFFRECTATLPENLTFEAFYYPPTHHLRLMVSGSSLYAEVTQDCGTLNPFSLMVPSRDLPQYPQTCHTKASALRIVPASTATDDYMSEIPQTGSLGDGTVKFFKPAIDKKQIIREINMHARLLAAGLKGKIRVTNFHSIVISDDAEMTLGLLFDLIPAIGESLLSEECMMATEYHAKWRQQVTAIVKELHSHEIVWGDVHPGNIVIDKNFDAWVVDFGGGWVEDFVDRKKAGTKEGDWQGVQKIFDEWINEQE